MWILIAFHLFFFFFISFESRVLVYCLEFHSVYLSPFIFSPTIMKKRTKHRAGTELIITDIILFVTFVFRHRVIQLDWNTIEECTYENDRHVVRCFVLFDERKKKKKKKKKYSSIDKYWETKKEFEWLIFNRITR